MTNWELETDTGIYFWGGILSNWALAPFTAKLTLTGDDVQFNNAEQYMMRIKAQVFGDEYTASLIMATTNPKEQKKLGRAIIGYSDGGWDPVARDLSYIGIYQKFMQNKGMKRALLGTGSKLIVEASPVDTKWGVGLSHLDLEILDRTKWRGRNWLGQILMKVRHDIREGQSSEFTTIDWLPFDNMEMRNLVDY